MYSVKLGPDVEEECKRYWVGPTDVNLEKGAIFHSR